MGKVVIKRGRGSITVEGPTARELEAAVRRTLGPALERMEEEVERIRKEDIQTRWPVFTGKSRDAWEVVTRIDPDRQQVTAALANEHVYVRFLKSTKEGKKELSTRLRSPLTTEVRRPLRAARKGLGKELEALVSKALKREVTRAK